MRLFLCIYVFGLISAKIWSYFAKCHIPEILILDEPMNGLDNQGVEDVREILMQLRDEGKTIILSSHNKEDIEILCDEVYEMDHGKLDVHRLMKS